MDAAALVALCCAWLLVNLVIPLPPTAPITPPFIEAPRKALWLPIGREEETVPGEFPEAGLPLPVLLLFPLPRESNAPMDRILATDSRLLFRLLGDVERWGRSPN